MLVIAAQLPTLRACEAALGRSALVRSCLGARAGRRAVLSWDPAVVVLGHDPPALDAAELVRDWSGTARSGPEVVVLSAAGRDALDVLARRHASVRVLAMPAGPGVLAAAVLDAARTADARRSSLTRASSTRLRPPSR